MISRSTTLWRRLFGLALALAVIRVVTPLLCDGDYEKWLRADRETQRGLADHLREFEAQDDVDRRQTPKNRFAGEWALVTHQMTALGLGQVVLQHPELKARYLPTIGRAAEKTFLREMRRFGTRAWRGEDALASLSKKKWARLYGLSGPGCGHGAPRRSPPVGESRAGP